MIISPVNPQILYTGSTYLFKTFDAGGQWFIGQGGTEIDGNPILLLAVAQANDNVLYLATFPFLTRGRGDRRRGGRSGRGHGHRRPR